MKIFDEKGIFIGAIDDNEYRRTKDSIMPIGIKVAVPKYNAPSSGYLIFLIASIFSAVAIAITILERWADIDNWAVMEEIVSGMFLMHRELGIVPLTAVIQFFALIILLRDHPLFIISCALWFGYLLCSFSYYKTDDEYQFFFGFLLGTVSIIFSLWAFTRCSGRMHCWFILLALFRTAIFLVPEQSMFPIVVFCLFLVYYIAEFMYVWKMFIHAGEGVRK